MVWARTKLVIFDNLYEPGEKDILFNYSGPHPEKFYNKVRAMMHDVFNVPVGRIQEMNYTWETQNNEDKFSIRWRTVKEMDIYTYLRYDVILTGTSANGEGPVSIRLKPRIVTEYPQDTLIQQSILYEMARRFWHNMFYAKQRQKWMEMGRDLASEFENTLKEYGEELRHHARVKVQ
ncbi:MAG: hypothetical protein U9Q92_05665 [archaeon]|nr:hypothetical protein [archaeon]